MAEMMTEQRLVSIARSYVWNMQKVIQNERTDDDDEEHWGDNQEHDRFLDGDDDVLSDSWRRCSRFHIAKPPSGRFPMAQLPQFL